MTAPKFTPSLYPSYPGSEHLKLFHKRWLEVIGHLQNRIETPDSIDIEFLFQYHYLKKGSDLSYHAFELMTQSIDTPFPLLHQLLVNDYIDANGQEKRLHLGWIKRFTDSWNKPGYKDLMVAMVERGFEFDYQSFLYLNLLWNKERDNLSSNDLLSQEPLEFMQHLFYTDFNPHHFAFDAGGEAGKVYMESKRLWIAEQASVKNPNLSSKASNKVKL